MKCIILGVGDVLNIFIVETYMELGKESIPYLDRYLLVRDNKI